MNLGEGYQEQHYSWINFARGEGYHTLAIDRLGVGNSSHPNPVLVRLPLDAAITSKIIQHLRTRSLPCLNWVPQSFERVILVGHSIASVIINYLIVHEPEIVDAVILTSYVHIFTKVNTSAQE